MDTLWTDFVNSDWHDFRESGKSEDRLVLSSWQKQFLVEWKLKATVPATEKELLTLKKLRTLLHDYAVSLSTGALLDDIDWNTLNQMMIQAPVTRQWIDSDQPSGKKLTYIPLVHDWNSVIAEIISDFASTVLEHDSHRIRICDNPDCRWVFYDDTRSRTKRYCEDKTCGNLMKVRRFRAKKATQQKKK